MNLGRQYTHTGIRTLPIEGYVKKTCFHCVSLYQIVYKGQTITHWQTMTEKGFRAFCAIVLEVGNG